MYCILGISTYLIRNFYGVRAMHNSLGRQAHTSGSRVRSQVNLRWICWDWDRYSPENVRFLLRLSFYQYSVLIFH